MTINFRLDEYDQLEALCAEEGLLVAPEEWRKGAHHALRIAFKLARQQGFRHREHGHQLGHYTDER